MSESAVVNNKTAKSRVTLVYVTYLQLTKAAVTGGWLGSRSFTSLVTFWPFLTSVTLTLASSLDLN